MVTAVLVSSRPRHLRYLLTQDGLQGTAFTIPNTPGGGVSPDLAADTVGLPAATELWRIARARVNGYGPLVAGVPLTQAQARALLSSDDPSSAVLTNRNVVSARMTLSPRSVAAGWAVDATVDAQGDPVVVVTAPEAAQTCYLDITTDIQV